MNIVTNNDSTMEYNHMTLSNVCFFYLHDLHKIVRLKYNPLLLKGEIMLCEKCYSSESCMILNSYVCNNYCQNVDSNYKYVIEPELICQAKTSDLTYS